MSVHPISHQCLCVCVCVSLLKFHSLANTLNTLDCTVINVYVSCSRYTVIGHTNVCISLYIWILYSSSMFCSDVHTNCADLFQWCDFTGVCFLTYVRHLKWLTASFKCCHTDVCLQAVRFEHALLRMEEGLVLFYYLI